MSDNETKEILYRRIDELEADRANRTRELLKVEQELVAKTSRIRELEAALAWQQRRSQKEAIAALDRVSRMLESESDNGLGEGVYYAVDAMRAEALSLAEALDTMGSSAEALVREVEGGQ